MWTRQVALSQICVGLWAAALLAGCGGRAADAQRPLPTEPSVGATAAVVASVPENGAATPTHAAQSVQTAQKATPTTTPEPIATARAAAAGEIRVDAAIPAGTISPYASGVTWGPLWVVRPEVMPLAEKLRPGMISFPGGEYGDTNNLQEIEIDRLMELATRLGSEPLIHVRLPGGTPEQAVALMKYANEQKNYNVKYWAIGNEPNLYAGKYKETPWDATYFAGEWRRFAQAMKAADPSIVLVGPEITQFAGTENRTRGDEILAADWMRTFLEMNGDLVDVVSFHRYPFPKDMHNLVDTTATELFANAGEWSAIIPSLRTLMVETTGRELPVAITEVNSHFTRTFHRPASPDTLPNALWWGDVFMQMLRQQVDIVNFWTLVTGDDQGGWGILARYGERPVYHTFMLYQQMGANLVAADAGLPGVQALAAQRDDGTLTLMVSNLTDSAQTAQLNVEGADFSEVEIWRLDAEHLGTQVEGETVANGDAITVPPESLTLYVLH